MKILHSRKFQIIMILFWPSVWLTYTNHMNSSFATVVSTLGSIWLAAHTYSDNKTTIVQQTLPTPPGLDNRMM